MFKVGDRVAWTGKAHDIVSPWLKTDKVYTIRGFDRNLTNDVGILLDGVYSGLNYPYNRGEVGFDSGLFRKVDDNFGEEVLKNIAEKIKEEQLELV